MSRTTAFRRMQAVGFSSIPLRDILADHDYINFGVHHAACFIATPGFIPAMTGTHAGSLLTSWLGVRQVGLEHELSPTGHSNEFHEIPPLPSFRASLGASMPWLACTTSFGAVPCRSNLGLGACCGIVDIDAARHAKADAALVLSMPVGSHGSGALAVPCGVAGPSSASSEGLDPV